MKSKRPVSTQFHESAQDDGAKSTTRLTPDNQVTLNGNQNDEIENKDNESMCFYHRAYYYLINLIFNYNRSTYLHRYSECL